MSKIKVGIIGGGWRAEFFIRCAKAISDKFEITSVLLRDEQKAKAFSEKMGVNTCLNFDEFIAQKPDYAILSIARDGMIEYIEKLFKVNMPILCETPPGATTDEYNYLWEIAKKYNGKIQVAEQYFEWPLYSTWLEAIKRGMIGEPLNINISAVHGYHGVNLIRRFLGITNQNCTIVGKSYSFPVVDTDGREGRTTEGKVVNGSRQRLTFEFDNGKIAFFDFSSVQYNSRMRTRHINIQGVKGEIDDLTIRYLNDNNEVVTQNIFRDDYGIYELRGLGNVGLMIGNEYFYKNPFSESRLNDDEVAIASLMYKMKDYIENGNEFYSLQDALQDSYLALEMDKALHNPLTEIKTQTQSWY